MTDRVTLLIVGGYGTFGGRLARLLSEETRLTLVIAGRSLGRASRFCAGLPAVARLVPAVFDRDGDLAGQLAALAPDTVVDASGPFQDYGDDPYRLVRACVAAGVHYIDLADGADFVAGIDAVDAAARIRGVHVLSGASSCPALTAAVVRRLVAEFGRVDAIAGGIAPSPFAGIGRNVIRAISGYAGRPTRIRREGAWTRAWPLTETRRDTIAPPGYLPLDSRLFSLVAVPDLVLVPAICPDARSVWIGAGPLPEILHRMLIALAWLVRWRLLPSLAFAAPLLHRGTEIFRRGDNRGGMFVEIRGLDLAGNPLTTSWHLVAEGDVGPFIPAMAVAAVVLKRLDGSAPGPGARPATGELELRDFERLFARHAIVTGVRRHGTAADRRPLYPRLLGSAWDRLPAAVRALHDAERSTSAHGRGSVVRGSQPLARLVAASFGFPPSCADTPVSVHFARDQTGEVWTRRFGRSTFASGQSPGSGRWRHLLVERFGPFAFGIALVVRGDRLHFVLRRWALFGMPLPLRLAPISRAWETESEGRFRFHVELGLPIVGLLVRYEGWLEPAPPAP